MSNVQRSTSGPAANNNNNNNNSSSNNSILDGLSNYGNVNVADMIMTVEYQWREMIGRYDMIAFDIIGFEAQYCKILNGFPVVSPLLFATTPPRLYTRAPCG
jgi:hypothetical protein